MADFTDRLSKNLAKLPPYLFARIDELKAEALKKGVDVIDMTVGDPDRPTFPAIVRSMKKALAVGENHQYPSYVGKLSFREAAASWYESRFGVTLDPRREVLTLIGSKEGIGHIPFAFLDPGDIVLVPDPSYPVYSAATLMAGGEPYMMPLEKKNGFLPDFSKIPKEVTDRAKLLFLNYPNNPTAATADSAFFESVVDFARRTGIIVCHDNAYSETYFDGTPPPPSSRRRVPGTWA
jgi:LL-diaminopimelate aminotransferase